MASFTAKEIAAAAAQRAALAAKKAKDRIKYSPKMLKKLGPSAKIDRPAVRKKNVFDLLARFKNYGIGQVVTRTIWKKYWSSPDFCDCFWTVTRVKPRNRGPGLNTGRAWGFLVWRGKLYHMGEERRIKTANKRGWFLVNNEHARNFLAHSKLPENIHEKTERVRKAAGIDLGYNVNDLFITASRVGPM